MPISQQLCLLPELAVSHAHVCLKHVYKQKSTNIFFWLACKMRTADLPCKRRPWCQSRCRRRRQKNGVWNRGCDCCKSTRPRPWRRFGRDDVAGGCVARSFGIRCITARASCIGYKGAENKAANICSETLLPRSRGFHCQQHLFAQGPDGNVDETQILHSRPSGSIVFGRKNKFFLGEEGSERNHTWNLNRVWKFQNIWTSTNS